MTLKRIGLVALDAGAYVLLIAGVLCILYVVALAVGAV